MNRRTFFTFYILFLTLMAYLLRVYRLDFFSLRGDEAFTVIFVQRTWEGLWKGISIIEPNPPLVYLLLRAWIFVVGTSEFATRYFSVFFGVLCVPLLYRVAYTAMSRSGRALQNPISIDDTTMLARSPFHRRPGFAADEGTWIGLFAATLITINPFQIWHSQDVRNYTLWPALSLFALYFFWKWWKAEAGLAADKPFAALAFYVFFALASLYTHYYDVFILLAANTFVFIFAVAARKWKTIVHWIAAQIALVLLYAPWILFGTNRISTYGEGSAEQGVALLDQFRRTVASFALGDTLPESVHAISWIPLALLLIIILVWFARRNFQASAFIFFWIALPTLALYAVSLGRPLFNERYLNGVAPAYYLAFAVGLAALYPPRARWHSLAFSVAILFFSLAPAYALANYWYDPNYAKAPDWRGLSQIMNANLRDGDIIVQNFTEMSAQYYRSGTTPVITVPRDFWWASGDAQTLERLNRDFGRIWFIPAQPDWWDPRHEAENFLSRYDDRQLEDDISGFRLQLYSTPRVFASLMTPMNARIGAATLAGFRLEKKPGMLHVVLYWKTASIEKDLHVFVHVSQSDGRVIAQSDGIPLGGSYPTSAWKPAEMIVDAYDIKTDAAGAFTLFAGMYDPDTGTRATAIDSAGVRYVDDRVMLAQISLP